MFGWFQSPATCPVDSAARGWLDQRWTWLEQQFGRGVVQRATVVLPLARYFPDPFQGRESDVRPLLNRLCGYLQLDASQLEFALFDDLNPVDDGSGRLGLAGLQLPGSDKFRIWIGQSSLDDPHALVGEIARELGRVHVLGHGRLSDEADDHEALAELLTIYFGLGVITANAVIRETNWKLGTASGWSIGRKSLLGMPECGYALARFALLRGERRPAWARLLRLDARTAFRQASRFLAEEPLRSPTQPDAGAFTA